MKRAQQTHVSLLGLMRGALAAASADWIRYGNEPIALFELLGVLFPCGKSFVNVQLREYNIDADVDSASLSDKRVVAEFQGVFWAYIQNEPNVPGPNYCIVTECKRDRCALIVRAGTGAYPNSRAEYLDPPYRSSSTRVNCGTVGQRVVRNKVVHKSILYLRTL